MTLQDQIRFWLGEDPGVTATDNEILARIKALHPSRFTDKQARTVQHAVKQCVRSKRVGSSSKAQLQSVPVFRARRQPRTLQYGRRLNPPRLAHGGPQ
jgi:hypothetical protein